ncbi:MAG: hypothetical protein JXK93_12600 [Sphaerochaetaceae bacterium]|nr:hypothetical protein [Sphaerochaetaceae bacterium]
MNPSLLRVLTGAAIIPAIILMDHLAGTFAITVILILLAVKEGRRFRPLPNIILLTTVSAAHTLQPYGRYLFSIFTHPVTLGSLAIGAHKALLLISFIYLSHYIMASKPVIPGKLGSLLSLQFYYLDRLTSEWKSIPHKRPYLAVIDALLVRVSDRDQEDAVMPSSTADTPGASVRQWEWSIGLLAIVYSILLFSTPVSELITRVVSG